MPVTSGLYLPDSSANCAEHCLLIASVVVGRHELVDMRLDVVSVYSMIHSGDPALQQRPESLNRVGMNMAIICFCGEWGHILSP